MKIAITTLGSRGDLQPFIALGLGLKDAGYDVKIISSRNEESFVKNYGLDHYPINYFQSRLAIDSIGNHDF